MSFASSFIFVLFSSAVLGYYLSREFMQFSVEISFGMSGIFAFVGIVMETFLFMIKDADNKKKKSN